MQSDISLEEDVNDLNHKVSSGPFLSLSLSLPLVTWEKSTFDNWPAKKCTGIRV